MMIRCAEVAAIVAGGEFTRVPSGTGYEEISCERKVRDACVGTKDGSMIARQPLIKWTHDPEFWSAAQAEHAVVSNYELVAFNLQPTDQFPTTDIGWELFGPPKRQTQLATGKCGTFEEAKAAAEAALAALLKSN